MKKKSLFFLLLLPMLLTSAWVRGQNLQIRMPDTSVVVGAVIDLPILADSSFTDSEVLSYTLHLDYDPYCLRIESVSSAGTLSEPFGQPTIKVEERVVTISGAGSQPLTGSGLFLKIRVRLLNTGWTRFGTNGNRLNLWNEGSPAMTQSFGLVQIGSPQTLSVSANTYLIAKGEQLKFNAWGGSLPYSWSVNDTAVASIDGDGLLSAKVPGRVIVQATDTMGISGWSQEVEIRPVRLSIPGDLHAKLGDTIDVPVLVSDLNGLNITSGSFRIRFSHPMLKLLGYSTRNTQLESYLVNMTDNETELKLVFAGSEPLAGNGTLVYLRFAVEVNQWGSNLDFQYALMNESVPVACQNGYFRVDQPSYRYISADNYSLKVGDVRLFRIYGGTPPYLWSVSDPTRASIGQNGWLKALRNGDITVRVIDSAGVTTVSEPVTIRETALHMAEVKVCNTDDVLRYPVYMDVNTPFDPILSFEGKIVFDSLYFELLGTELSEFVPTGWTLSNRVAPTEVQIAASGTQSLNQAGPLMYLLLKPKAAFGPGAWTNLRLDSWLFNEGSPGYLWDRWGSIQGREPERGCVSIWTNANWPCYMDTVLFQSNVGEIPPSRYQWIKNGLEIPGANQPELRIQGLDSRDTIRLKVLYDHSCIVDTALYSNWINFPVLHSPASIDTLAGDTVVYRTDDHWWKLEIVDYEPDVEYFWTLPKGFRTYDYDNIGTCLYVQATDSAQSGWATVFGFNKCGVSDTARIHIRVRPTPIVPDSAGITGPDQLCAGTPDALYRVWPKLEGATYLWALADGFSGTGIADSIHISVADTATGGQLVVYSVFETDTLLLAEMFVDIRTKPVSPGWIYGPQSIFKYEDTVYYSVDWNPGILSYRWTLPDGLSGSSETDEIKAAVTSSEIDGWVTAIGIGACGITDTVRLHVRSWKDTTIYEPSIWGPQFVCQGEDSLYFQVVNTKLKGPFVWTLPAGFMGYSTADTILVSVGTTAKSDTIRVSASLPVGGIIEVAKAFVEVSSLPEKAGPVTGPSFIEMASDSATYSVPEVPGAKFYWWETPEGLWGWSETNQITVHAIDSTFKGYLRVQALSWCGPGLSDSILITVNRGTGWAATQANGLTYWPNPVKDELLLRLPENYSDAIIEIRDLTGRLLESGRWGGQATCRLNFRESAPGLYHLTIRWNDGQQSIKILKQ